MLKHILYLILLFSSITLAQNESLAQSFFEDGEYKKAILEYDKLLEKQPGRIDYFLKKIKCHQELENFALAEKLINEGLQRRYRRPELYVELGYNYSLQKDSLKANTAYRNAIKTIESNPNYAYAIGKSFEKYSLLHRALETYHKAANLNKEANFNFQLAGIYGQLNEIAKMFDSYLDLLSKNKSLLPSIQRLISEFINDDAANENNILLKHAILKKLQANPNILWNEQLSWLYVQQKEYNKAFIQEKAIYKREGQTLDRIFSLALEAKNNNNYNAATTIFDFVKEQHLEENTRIKVHQYILEMKVAISTSNEYNAIENEYVDLLNNFGFTQQTINLQLDYANLLAFKSHKIKDAIIFLKEHNNQNLGRFDKARYQMTLADVLVADSQFNQALINYSKIQRSLKNNILSQEARYKVAKTSYYKGDFDWALQQLKVLKSSTSQLIANDALALHLLINDHVKEDSLHLALKDYAKADLFAFQNKKNEAIEILDHLLKHYKGNPIEDDALFLQAYIFEKEKNYTKAKYNYEFIINNLKESVFLDDALYRLANLYLHHFNNSEKAKEYFEAIIFDHADSIHFVESQKNYRKLRGDSIGNIN